MSSVPERPSKAETLGAWYEGLVDVTSHAFSDVLERVPAIKSIDPTARAKESLVEGTKLYITSRPGYPDFYHPDQSVARLLAISAEPKRSTGLPRDILSAEQLWLPGADTPKLQRIDAEQIRIGRERAPLDPDNRRASGVVKLERFGIRVLAPLKGLHSDHPWFDVCLASKTELQLFDQLRSGEAGPKRRHVAEAIIFRLKIIRKMLDGPIGLDQAVELLDT